ncbi:MAG: PAS domain S-box protein [Deltaproteobacteria bacterium]|nr:PAS domain S-box protein [Deltaproteobacteria bacterium]
MHESEEKFRVLVENANDIVYSLTSDGVFTYVSPTWTRILGHDISEVENHPFQAFVHPEDLPECLEFLERTINTGNKQAGVEYRVLHIDGNWRWHTTNASPIHNANGEVVAFMGIARDITERKRMEEALRESEEKRLLALNGAEMGMWDLDISTMSGTTDEKAAQILGYQKDDILPKIHDWDQMTHPDDVPRIKECIQAHIEGRMPIFKTDHRMRTASGEWKWVHGRGKITKRHMDGSPIRISGTIHDITERKLAEEKLAYFAIHDQLTGLLNRRSIEDMLNRTIARAKRGAVSYILYMDLDNFKEVNDSVGHSVGDEVLITIAGLLKDAVRTEDIVFRLGGDEFAVLLDGIDGKEAFPAAERLRSDGALTMGELLSQADIAMYRAKAEGKNRVVIS